MWPGLPFWKHHAPKEAQMIEVTDLTKRYGSTVAVDNLSFQVKPGVVTGFLGPNGAGKSTTMRMILGLDRPTSGSATINGRPYATHKRPLMSVGALLEANAVHTGRSAYNHLLALAQSNGIPRSRVDAVLEQVGLTSVAKRRIGAFSLGMGQRLGVAAALLGDPDVLMFDEPVNGLDPEGIVWIRTMLKSLAAEGRTVFVSSHLMSEMALTAEHLIVIGQGKLIADMGVQEFIQRSVQNHVRVRTPDPDRLRALLAGHGATVTANGDVLTVTGLECPQIGDIAGAAGCTLHELSPQRASLEEAFMELTKGSVEYRGETRTSESVLEGSSA
jgi:ABC-2 type transport system ATP-binding protein